MSCLLTSFLLGRDALNCEVQAQCCHLGLIFLLHRTFLWPTSQNWALCMQPLFHHTCPASTRSIKSREDYSNQLWSLQVIAYLQHSVCSIFPVFDIRRRAKATTSPTLASNVFFHHPVPHCLRVAPPVIVSNVPAVPHLARRVGMFS